MHRHWWLYHRGRDWCCLHCGGGRLISSFLYCSRGDDSSIRGITSVYSSLRAFCMPLLICCKIHFVNLCKISFSNAKDDRSLIILLRVLRISLLIGFIDNNFLGFGRELTVLEIFQSMIGRLVLLHPWGPWIFLGNHFRQRDRLREISKGMPWAKE